MNVFLNTVAVAGPNVTGLKDFVQGDGIYIVSVVCAFIIIKTWREAQWIKVFSTLFIYAIIVSLLKGEQLLSVMGGVLKWFGIETGL